MHPILQRVYSARDIESFADTEYALQALIRPEQISHVQFAAEQVARHIRQGSSILIFGDYDADGATSTALCIRALHLFEHQRVDFLLPDRVRDGYGVSDNAAQRIVELKPQLVITVDTGIASFDGIRSIIEHGIEVVITDHHLPADHLPDKATIVNPNAFADSAGKCLAGVGVAFYLMLAVRSKLREQGWFDDRPEPNLAECLDLVAIGTVADLVPLDYNNRILVKEGLKRLRAGASSEGIKALVRQAGRNQSRLTAQDIAFSLAPRINAAGRLDDMSIGVQALLAEDMNSAQQLAKALDDINSYRRELQGEMTQQAMTMLPKITKDDSQACHVLYQPDWHEGIVGIIASKIKDETFRPSIAFARTDNGLLKGSGRSIRGVHMRDMLDLVDKTDATIIERFGGHAMAAGLTIREDRLPLFSETLADILHTHVDRSCFDNIVECDGELGNDDLSMELALLLEQGGPWGQRFALPSFQGHFRVLDQRVLADRHIKFIVTPEQGQHHEIDAIMFYATEQQLKTNFQRLRLHYELNINEYRGEQNLQLLIRHIL